MSRYVSFYKLNSREGKECLYEDLTSQTKYEKSFADYITDRASELGNNFITSYDQVIKSILKDFNEIRPGELSEIVNWYAENADRNVSGANSDWHKNQKELSILLKRSGIELLFEIIATTTCYAFIFQYGNFSSHYKLDAFDEGDEGSNIKSFEFIRFLDYVILLTCKINEAGWDHTFNYSNEFSDNQLRELEGTRIANKDNTVLFQLINNEFEFLKQFWVEHKNQDKNNAYESSPQVNLVYNTYHFLKACLDMKAAMYEENTNIVMIHC